MRVSTLVLALAALAALGGCNRVQPGAAKIAIPVANPSAGPPMPALPPAAAGPQTAGGPQPAATPQVAAGPQSAGGLWRQRVTGPAGVSVTRYCLDPAAASALASFNGELGGRCAQHQMALQSDGAWHFKTVCDSNIGAVTTQGTLRGDFARHYVVEAAQQGVHGMIHVTADVQRLGGCPSGMKPGDVILPGGAKSRLSALPASA